eukprot:371501_1
MSHKNQPKTKIKKISDSYESSSNKKHYHRGDLIQYKNQKARILDIKEINNETHLQILYPSGIEYSHYDKKMKWIKIASNPFRRHARGSYRQDDITARSKRKSKKINNKQKRNVEQMKSIHEQKEKSDIIYRSNDLSRDISTKKRYYDDDKEQLFNSITHVSKHHRTSHGRSNTFDIGGDFKQQAKLSLKLKNKTTNDVHENINENDNYYAHHTENNDKLKVKQWTNTLRNSNINKNTYRTICTRLQEYINKDPDPKYIIQYDILTVILNSISNIFANEKDPRKCCKMVSILLDTVSVLIEYYLKTIVITFNDITLEGNTLFKPVINSINNLMSHYHIILKDESRTSSILLSCCSILEKLTFLHELHIESAYQLIVIITKCCEYTRHNAIIIPFLKLLSSFCDDPNTAKLVGESGGNIAIVYLLRHFMSVKHQNNKINIMTSILQVLKKFTVVIDNVIQLVYNEIIVTLCNLCDEIRRDTKNNGDTVEILIKIFSNICICWKQTSIITKETQSRSIYNILKLAENYTNSVSIQKCMLDAMLDIITEQNIELLFIHDEGLCQIFEMTKTLIDQQDIVNCALCFIKSICVSNAISSWLVKKSNIFEELKSIIVDWSSNPCDETSIRIQLCCQIIRKIRNCKHFDKYAHRFVIISGFVSLLEINYNGNVSEQTKKMIFTEILQTFVTMTTHQNAKIESKMEVICKQISKSTTRLLLSWFHLFETDIEEIITHFGHLLCNVSKYEAACIYLNDIKLIKIACNSLQNYSNNVFICVKFGYFLKNLLSNDDGCYEILEEQMNVLQLLDTVIKLHPQNTELKTISEDYIQIINELNVSAPQIQATKSEESIDDIKEDNYQHKQRHKEEKQSPMKQKMLQNHELEKQKVNKAYNALKKLHFPLHKFTSEHLKLHINWWVLNDINYQKHLLHTMDTFIKFRVSGHLMCQLEANIVKQLVAGDLCMLIPKNVVNIMFNFAAELKLKNTKFIESTSAEQLAYILYGYNLNCLLNKIIRENIDGEKFVSYIQTENDFIGKTTGWEETDVQQLYAMLFRYDVLSSSEFKDNMDQILTNASFEFPIINHIKNTILQFNVEKLQIQIRKGQHIEKFSDAIINMVDQLEMKNNKNYFEEHIVKRIYESVAKCFVIGATQHFKEYILSSKSWVCCNCSNFNFCKYMESKFNEQLSICSLCGIEQIESIILNIKRFDTFVMVNDTSKYSKHVLIDEKTDEIDKLIIEPAIKASRFNLSCPNQNGNEPCPSLKRLAKNLIIHKRWIQKAYEKSGKDAIGDTTYIDPAVIIDNRSYRKIFLTCIKNLKKLTDVDMNQLQQIFKNNVKNIQSIKTFFDIGKKGLVNILKTHTNVKIVFAARLHKAVLESLKTEAHRKQFGSFLSELDMNSIDADYYHILKTHINDGSKISIKNTFRFFATVVHYQDKISLDQQEQECISCKRRAQRVSLRAQLTSITSVNNSKQSININNKSDDKNIWSLKEYYNQSQLDIIHSYLVHSNYKYFIQRKSKHAGLETESKTEQISSNPQIINTKESNDKYFSYGFGVEHSYQHLSSKYSSIHDELLYNTISDISISEILFQTILVKSIKMHKLTLTDEIKLTCKYFDENYNILRNAPMGIRHMFALIMYTDVGAFCTIFRSTYRKMENETTNAEVTKRHIEFYKYARALFEAIEFYGEPMPSKLKVYHGLNKMIRSFEKFTAYFHQPISTTTILSRAQEFSQENGIVLTLKSGKKSVIDLKQIPKFLSVSWCSDFPFEDEKLFYGSFVRFQIHDIIEFEGNKIKFHKSELLMLNKFQQTLQ